MSSQFTVAGSEVNECFLQQHIKRTQSYVCNIRVSAACSWVVNIIT